MVLSHTAEPQFSQPVRQGVQPPQASLGTLIKDGYTFLNQSWWPTIGSAATLALATLGSTLFGEALRDAADPKLKGHGR